MFRCIKSSYLLPYICIIYTHIFIPIYTYLYVYTILTFLKENKLATTLSAQNRIGGSIPKPSKTSYFHSIMLKILYFLLFQIFSLLVIIVSGFWSSSLLLLSLM